MAKYPTKRKGIGAGQASDLKWVEASARQVAEFATGYTIVVEKSTLPVKTAEVIKDISSRKNLETHIADSSWVLNTDSKDSIDFQIAFLNTIYKPLKNYTLVDQDILKEWFQLKVQDIALKKSNIVVGHKDLLIIRLLEELI